MRNLDVLKSRADGGGELPGEATPAFDGRALHWQQLDRFTQGRGLISRLHEIFRKGDA